MARNAWSLLDGVNSGIVVVHGRAAGGNTTEGAELANHVTIIPSPAAACLQLQVRPGALYPRGWQYSLVKIYDMCTSGRVA